MSSISAVQIRPEAYSDFLNYVTFSLILVKQILIQDQHTYKDYSKHNYTCSNFEDYKYLESKVLAKHQVVNKGW